VDELTAPTKTCTQCGQTKPLSEFYKNCGMRDGLLNQCKTCVDARQKAYRQGPGREAYLAQQRQYTAANREAKRAYDAEYRKLNRERLLAAKREWYQENREHHAALGKVWREANAEQKKQMDKAFHERRRGELLAAIFGHYGTACACCGITENLTIDHINGDGAEHRASLAAAGATNVTGQAFYRWLVRSGFPEGYQTLCMPCNVSKGIGAQCRLDHIDPERRTVHQRRKKAS
jgi:hypothetical protein